MKVYRILYHHNGAEDWMSDIEYCFVSSRKKAKEECRRLNDEDYTDNEYIYEQVTVL